MNKFNVLKCVSVFAALAMSGCQQYLDRNEGVTSFAGNSQAANEAKMVVDPWPRNVENTDIPADGQRMANTIDKYKNAHAPDAQADTGDVDIFLGPQN